MKMKLQTATDDDVADLVSLRAAVNEHLTVQFGRGYWASGMTEKGPTLRHEDGGPFSWRAIAGNWSRR